MLLMLMMMMMIEAQRCREQKTHECIQINLEQYAIRKKPSCRRPVLSPSVPRSIGPSVHCTICQPVGPIMTGNDLFEQLYHGLVESVTTQVFPASGRLSTCTVCIGGTSGEHVRAYAFF